MGQKNFGEMLEVPRFLDEVSAAKIVFFGESHFGEKALSMQVALQNHMIKENFEADTAAGAKKVRLNVVLSHFDVG